MSSRELSFGSGKSAEFWLPTAVTSPRTCAAPDPTGTQAEIRLEVVEQGELMIVIRKTDF